MCEVEFILGNKKQFDYNQIQSNLSNLLKDNINYKIEESEMELALGCLQAGVDYMNLKSGNSKQFILKKYTLG